MSGWSNYPGIVTSFNMIEREMGNRGSKSNILNILFSPWGLITINLFLIFIVFIIFVKIKLIIIRNDFII